MESNSGSGYDSGSFRGKALVEHRGDDSRRRTNVSGKDKDVKSRMRHQASSVGFGHGCDMHLYDPSVLVSMVNGSSQLKFGEERSIFELKLQKASHDLELQLSEHRRQLLEKDSDHLRALTAKEQELSSLKDAHVLSIEKTKVFYRKCLAWTAGGSFLTGVGAALYAVAKVPGLAEKLSRKSS